MKMRKETSIENAFTVEKIVTVYHLKLGENDKSEIKPEQNGVAYDFWQMLYLDHGHYTCRIDGNEYTMLPGKLLFCEPGKTRLSLHRQDAFVGIVSFRCNSSKMDFFKNRLFNLSEDERKILHKILNLGVESFNVIPDEEQFFGQQPKDGVSDYKLQAIKNNLELLLINLYEKIQLSTAPTPPNQTKYYESQFYIIEDYLKSHLCENITVSDLSKQLGFSVSTIKRICNSYAGCGVINYLLTLKIDKAKRLMRETDMNITQIAELLGFSSIHYFSRVFKSRTGISPRRYSNSVLRN